MQHGIPLLSFFVVMSVTGCDVGKTEAVKRFPTAVLEVATSSPKVVEVETGELSSIDVELRYNGAEIQKIKNVVGNCQCSHAKMVPDVLRPGEAQRLVVQYDARGVPPGTHAYSFVVETETGHSYSLKDALTVKLHHNIVFDTPVIQLGDVMPGAEIEQTCGLLIRGRFALRDIGVSASSEDINVEFKKSSLNVNSVASDGSKVTRCSMLVKMLTGDRQGVIDEYVDVTFRGFSGRDRTIRVPVNGRILDAVTISPGRLFLGLIHPSESKVLTFRVLPRSKGEIAVKSVAGPDWLQVTHSSRMTADTGSLRLTVVLRFGEHLKPAGTLVLKVLGQASGKAFEIAVPCVFVSSPHSKKE